MHSAGQHDNAIPSTLRTYWHYILSNDVLLPQIVGAGDERHANELIEERRIMAVAWGPAATPTTFVRVSWAASLCRRV